MLYLKWKLLVKMDYQSKREKKSFLSDEKSISVAFKKEDSNEEFLDLVETEKSLFMPIVCNSITI